MSIFRRDQHLSDDQPSIVARFQAVASSEDLDALFARAEAETVFLFLHDPYCPISSSAYEEVEQVDAVVQLLDVSQFSRLGKEVQQRTGIRHESPQAIVFKDGKPAWHASHGRIRAETLRDVLAAEIS